MFKEVIEKNQEYIDDVKQWSDEQYNKYFGKYFNQQDKLWDKFKLHELHGSHLELTDDELSDILTEMPLNLVAASAQLAEFKTQKEVIKMRIKQEQSEYEKDMKNLGLSATAAKEEASKQLVEDKLLVTVYDSIIERVERQISYSKELIMGAKKIWDARRNSEEYMPGGDGSVNKLGEYEFDRPSICDKTYIK